VQPPRFYCPALDGPLAWLDEHESRHATRSLRLRPGDQVVLFDGCGHVAHGRIAPPTPASRGRRSTKAVAVQVAQRSDVAPPTRTLSLLVAACKGPRLDWLVEKTTELGVTKLLFTEFERSVVRPGARHLERLRRVAIEACKQSRRVWLPEIGPARPLCEAVRPWQGPGLLVADPGDDSQPATAWLANYASSWPQLACVIGPEGGLSPSERDLLRECRAQFVSLALHTLRVETAAVALAAVWAGSMGRR